jgi:hypothetical protein
VSALVDTLSARNPDIRNRSFASLCEGLPLAELLAEDAALEKFRHHTENLYEGVRALFFLHALHRFYVPARDELNEDARISSVGNAHLLQRRFEEAIRVFRAQQQSQGASDAISSSLAAAYKGAAFETLARQVRQSVRSVRGNQWMFRVGHAAEYPLRLRQELSEQEPDGSFPVLHEATPVRMDLTHSGWSDIFFLGMDYPEGARVINISIDLSLGDENPSPPVEGYLRTIDRPILRLVSVDLDVVAEIDDVQSLFDFGRDYLGLLKAAVIAAGVVPPGMEGETRPIGPILAALTGRPDRGLELVSRVKNIPKGSRLAVSTNLLACLISLMMRATGQVRRLDGGLEEGERQIVAARAILGEWLGGSGGGWQDSGGLWPGVKLIEGRKAAPGDIEFGTSRGALLPTYQSLGEDRVPAAALKQLKDSLLLVHGGMAQDVGPILDVVTEKYLLRSELAWEARQEAIALTDEMLGLLSQGRIRELGALTQRNFDGPIQTIIPWASNDFTETLIQRTREQMGDSFWGFWMLGGMSGGGMGFLIEPARKAAAKAVLRKIMVELKNELETGVPFAITPVVYSFEINERGSWAEARSGNGLPSDYYYLRLPVLLRRDPKSLSAVERADLARYSRGVEQFSQTGFHVESLLERILPKAPTEGTAESNSLGQLLTKNGFDAQEHERIREDLRRGRVGLAQNRLPAATRVEDILPDDVHDAACDHSADDREMGEAALADGRVAVVTFAGGVGSRWTKGAGVVKALNPFAKFARRHRTFIELQLAKTRRSNDRYPIPAAHIFTTSYLTHGPIAARLAAENNYGYNGPLHLSQGRSVGQRFVPMARDLRFAWEETAEQTLDAPAQKMRDSVRNAVVAWVESAGEGSDYTDNIPSQCMHPTGHWYEIPNMLRNGVLRSLLAERPRLRYLLAHNIDTLGASLDPTLLGFHIRSEAGLTTEVIARRIEDRGGGLGRVNGRPRLIEGMALPREEIEFDLTYYNTNTSWIDVDRLLDCFELSREQLANEDEVDDAVRRVAARMPTYITIKDAKKRWGKGQEDIFPVAQFEKLWVDMTALPELTCRYVKVTRQRGQQLKEQAQLDGWLRDGSADYVASLCDFSN